MIPNCVMRVRVCYCCEARTHHEIINEGDGSVAVCDECGTEEEL